MSLEIPTDTSYRSPEEVQQAIEAALQDEGLVLARETDLTVVDAYLQTQQEGTLHLVLEDGEGDSVAADVPCVFGRTTLGDYILRAHPDAIEDVLTNGKTYLQTKALEQPPVYFRSTREVYFGRTRAFTICTAGEGVGHG